MAVRYLIFMVLINTLSNSVSSSSSIDDLDDFDDNDAFEALLEEIEDAAANGLIVTTTEGLIEGIIRQGISQWIGVPYAQPPIDDLRFEAPQSLEPRLPVEIFDATQTLDSIPVCPQIIGSFRGNEDCLYLNIFKSSNTEQDEELPVMLWVPGGRFELGGGSTFIYDPTNWLNNPNANDVIIVTINYRIGLDIIFIYNMYLVSYDIPTTIT